MDDVRTWFISIPLSRWALIVLSAGYEHPCQFMMSDIQLNVDDDFLHSDLRSTYAYSKAPVPFSNMQDLKDCPYLGGGTPIAIP